MSAVFPNHRWQDSARLVHHISRINGGDIEIKWRGARCLARNTAGEVRTICGITLGDDCFPYTLDAPTCLWCVVHMFIGWRKPSWPKD